MGGGFPARGIGDCSAPVQDVRRRAGLSRCHPPCRSESWSDARRRAVICCSTPLVIAACRANARPEMGEGRLDIASPLLPIVAPPTGARPRSASAIPPSLIPLRASRSSSLCRRGADARRTHRAWHEHGSESARALIARKPGRGWERLRPRPPSQRRTAGGDRITAPPKLAHLRRTLRWPGRAADAAASPC